ncbi:hypothetical protein BWK63_04025 [Flavobacterium covae]|uniref:HTH cro/C1-type domain-containing protein n=1 Tax=Flavobacterium covae TaxID=2906076 RepID=A0ABW8PEC8_9FLAO|nr:MULTISPECIES: hypothetical protein [Flavobacterium]MCJ1806444.1 hypothetical protein [Flavobacterium covae]OWP81831.1 hypothetical protein BWK63_04025 [Flavobacterium covae]POR23821.1 hypothetical protein BWK57_00495 [Flavobacterium columnare]
MGTENISALTFTAYPSDRSKPKKIADILGITLDFLMNDKPQDDTVFDSDVIYRMEELQKLPEAEKEKINAIIDAFIRDTKAKQAFRLS